MAYIHIFKYIHIHIYLEAHGGYKSTIFNFCASLHDSGFEHSFDFIKIANFWNNPFYNVVFSNWKPFSRVCANRHPQLCTSVFFVCYLTNRGDSDGSRLGNWKKKSGNGSTVRSRLSSAVFIVYPEGGSTTPIPPIFTR